MRFDPTQEGAMVRGISPRKRRDSSRFAVSEAEAIAAARALLAADRLRNRISDERVVALAIRPVPPHERGGQRATEREAVAAARLHVRLAHLRGVDPDPRIAALATRMPPPAYADSARTEHHRGLPHRLQVVLGKLRHRLRA